MLAWLEAAAVAAMAAWADTAAGLLLPRLRAAAAATATAGALMRERGEAMEAEALEPAGAREEEGAEIGAIDDEGDEGDAGEEGLLLLLDEDDD